MRHEACGTTLPQTCVCACATSRCPPAHKALTVWRLARVVAAVIQECANAINAGSTLQDLAMMTHTHPTLCEVLDEAFKAGLGRAAH
mmetsp:Transcript_66815/g.132444  ORF Transcript_66815/g.132444 Transcript_66815/m.132444 type:complete len:87 (+) Transcript_66815:1548-1808(+)